MSDMITVAGVRFKTVGKIYYFDPGDLKIKQFDHVIVETARGVEYGEVALAPREVSADDVVRPLKGIRRIATSQDDDVYQKLLEKKGFAREVFLEKVKQNKLKMKLIDVDFTFDRKKAVFYFTAEGRVDFRELVKDMATVLHLRIELRQIGVRDEAAVFKSIGMCGRQTCCSKWMGDFKPVSIKMAKEQNLSLNSTKISGACGRLLCCLNFEEAFYEEINKKMPKYGKTVMTPDGEGQVYKVNALKETVTIKRTDSKGDLEIKTYPLTEVEYQLASKTNKQTKDKSQTATKKEIEKRTNDNKRSENDKEKKENQEKPKNNGEPNKKKKITKDSNNKGNNHDQYKSKPKKNSKLIKN